MNDGDYWDYIPSGTGKGKPVSNRPLPIVAITTTAGTGSEADAALSSRTRTRMKKTGFVHPDLFPVLSIVDPELMLTVPPLFSGLQGFDALFHSVEGYVSNGTNLMSDMYALEAIKHISRYLPRAVADGSDLKARTHVAFGNTLSGYVMCVGRCTSEHSLEHALSAYHQELPHGAGLIMISKAYFTHLIERHVADERFVRMAQAMGMPPRRRTPWISSPCWTSCNGLRRKRPAHDDYGIERRSLENGSQCVVEITRVSCSSATARSCPWRIAFPFTGSLICKPGSLYHEQEDFNHFLQSAQGRQFRPPVR